MTNENIVDRAIAGDLEAIEVNFHLMIQAFNGIESETPTGFVKDRTLDELAILILRWIDREGRILVPRFTFTAESPADSPKTEIQIGQEISARITRTPAATDRATVYLSKERPNPWGPTPIRDYFYVSPPSIALRDWASRWILRRG